jgi:hypothetical protein
MDLQPFLYLGRREPSLTGLPGGCFSHFVVLRRSFLQESAHCMFIEYYYDLPNL